MCRAATVNNAVHYRKGPPITQGHDRGARFVPIPAPVARAPEFLGEILELRQAIVHAQRPLLVVDVHRGLELELWDHRGEHVSQLQWGMLGEQVPTAALAPLTQANRRFVVGANVVCAASHSDRARLPQRKGIHRARRPVTAGLAVAVSIEAGSPLTVNSTAPQKHLALYSAMAVGLLRSIGGSCPARARSKQSYFKQPAPPRKHRKRRLSSSWSWARSGS